MPPRITATVPFSSAEPDGTLEERAEFMRRAQDQIVETGLPGINHDDPNDAETVMRCFDLDTADCTERGYQLSVEDQNCAWRLLEAGLLDQGRDEIIKRWGSNDDQ